MSFETLLFEDRAELAAEDSVRAGGAGCHPDQGEGPRELRKRGPQRSAHLRHTTNSSAALQSKGSGG